MPVSTIVYEKGTADGLYIGTDAGVYYKNNTLTDWVFFGQGLPVTSVIDIQIQYAAKKIRIATYGRGI